MPAGERLPAIAENELTEAQRAAIKVVTAGKRPDISGPFAALLHSPELCARAAQLGEFVRFGTSLPPRLSELAILVTAQRWRAQFEWFVHAQMARAGGLSDDIIEAIRVDKKPAAMQADEAIIYEFCNELYDTRRVSDATYAKVLAAFGETALVEIIGISGYYSLVSMVLNVARVPLPAGETYPFAE